MILNQSLHGNNMKIIQNQNKPVHYDSFLKKYKDGISSAPDESVKHFKGHQRNSLPGNSSSAFKQNKRQLRHSQAQAQQISNATKARDEYVLKIKRDAIDFESSKSINKDSEDIKMGTRSSLSHHATPDMKRDDERIIAKKFFESRVK